MDEFDEAPASEASKKLGRSVPSISELVTDLDLGATRVRPGGGKRGSVALGRRIHKRGGLQRPRGSPFLTMGEMALYYSQMEEKEQADVISVLLACRKLEKLMEDRHSVIDMLEGDLEQARKTISAAPDDLTSEQFTNLLDLDAVVPNAYFRLPQNTSQLYSRLHADAAVASAMSATKKSEVRIYDGEQDCPFQRMPSVLQLCRVVSSARKSMYHVYSQSPQVSS